VLRRLRPEDAATLRRWHADPRYMEHLGGEPTDDPADTDTAIVRWHAHWDEHGFGLLAVEHRETAALVGRGGPQFHRVWRHDPEVGWAVDPEWWGRGIATEMGAAFVAWAFGDLGFRRVVSITTRANVASLRVMEKLGFTPLTTVHDDVRAVELLVHRLETTLD
jgi:RimJ/RimL family protein N-acetyltransferase